MREEAWSGRQPGCRPSHSSCLSPSHSLSEDELSVELNLEFWPTTPSSSPLSSSMSSGHDPLVREDTPCSLPGSAPSSLFGDSPMELVYPPDPPNSLPEWGLDASAEGVQPTAMDSVSVTSTNSEETAIGSSESPFSGGDYSILSDEVILASDLVRRWAENCYLSGGGPSPLLPCDKGATYH
ncbi:hypothetical protein NLI96_g7387 [Meripilus lineatus]|uniref:Uncharacterized protein n=1 Tax=Meripilus lineatus TaxID=2056292 RepID=A0AAD5YC44_9APHY|nr:hypothetical protein NLI96_g7387 [Physisporinus lineatus]